jgi:hypothetical protein
MKTPSANLIYVIMLMPITSAVKTFFNDFSAIFLFENVEEREGFLAFTNNDCCMKITMLNY